MNTYLHYRWAYCFIIPIIRLLFPLRIHHAERLPDGPMVICAPHSALVDPILIMEMMTIRRYPRFLAKKELFSVPVIGPFLRRIGMIPVDRGKADISSIKEALKILKDKGIIGIFPEGTRVKEEHASQAKTGAVMLASRTGVPILPVWMPRKKRLFRRIDMVIGEPYSLPVLRGSAEYLPYAEELMRRIGLLQKEVQPCS
ncbi:MAG: 1-acyl-sn-glycerol-3-phosphate acyltransferase [Oscillospiraceae bacterium]|nr:1-acyl-sn-glycerol-3-phosphate acyltransferase [Oscillospiraceae bacterium]